MIRPCDICGVTPEKRSLCQDHDHRCCEGIKGCDECKRGWLCGKCNMALGLLQDDIAILEAAIAYLRGYGLD
ncbi:endonuclease domain-containing protein [Micromonospora sp. CB01531]|uniref:endonuclease domain-containing protein n=1 Tax=Micromonospora sp. CB01531 TaxID=1718947 RepID=UPI00093F23DA